MMAFCGLFVLTQNLQNMNIQVTHTQVHTFPMFFYYLSSFKFHFPFVMLWLQFDCIHFFGSVSSRHQNHYRIFQSNAHKYKTVGSCLSSVYPAPKTKKRRPSHVCICHFSFNVSFAVFSANEQKKETIESIDSSWCLNWHFTQLARHLSACFHCDLLVQLSPTNLLFILSFFSVRSFHWNDNANRHIHIFFLNSSIFHSFTF